MTSCSWLLYGKKIYEKMNKSKIIDQPVARILEVWLTPCYFKNPGILLKEPQLWNLFQYILALDKPTWFIIVQTRKIKKKKFLEYAILLVKPAKLDTF